MIGTMKAIHIANKVVSERHPTFIIAEAGVNHNGQLKLAKKLIDAAILAGADAVKFQTYKAEEVVTKKAELAEYAKTNSGKNITQLQMIKKMELTYKDFQILKKYCDKKGIIFLSTPHSFDAIDFLEKIVPAYKFGSGDLTNTPALRHAAKKGKPMILGTGMATLQEVKHAVNVIKSQKNTQIILLHCTTSYPCPLEEVNLRSMLTMKKELKCLIGYSDHTVGILVPALAVTLGATVIEKHFTLDRKLPGPDHKASLEPDELKQMIVEIRNTEKILGNHIKKPTASEKKLMKQVRKSIVSNQDIQKGTIIKKHMLTIKRPGTGLPPEKLPTFIGKKAKQTIKKDEILKKHMVE